MPRTITKTVFTYEELSESAQAKARDWWREGGLDYDWWDLSYQDFDRIAVILGIEIDRKSVELVSGKTRYDPKINFSGFWSQGDGARFAGSYRYKKGAHKAIRKYAPKDAILHAIADDLLALQKKHNYKLESRVTYSGSHYEHEYCTDIDTVKMLRPGEYFDNLDRVDIETDKEMADILRRFMRWIYKSLQDEYEDLTSDESVAESIIANEYEFDEEGRRAA